VGKTRSSSPGKRSSAKSSPGRVLRSEEAAQRLKQYVLDSGLRHGDKLPTEAELADEFDISRISFREATKALSFLGILEAKPRRGTVIAPLNLDRLGEYLGFHVAIGDFPAEELAESLAVIDVGLLERVMECAKPDQLNELEAIARNPGQNRDQWVANDRAFHAYLRDITENKMLITLGQLLHQAFFHATEHYRPQPWDIDRSVNEHLAIVEALRERNLPLAQGLLRRQLLRAGHLE